MGGRLAIASTQTALGRRFGNYKPMEEQAVREAIVAGGGRLERLAYAFVDYLKICGHLGEPAYNYHDNTSINPPYEAAENLVKGLGISEDLVSLFFISLNMHEHQDYYKGYEAGTFLSALINSGPWKSLELPVGHLDKPLEHLGALNEGKIIRVMGDVGAFAGRGMGRGRLIIEGNADDYVGSDMEGGTIIVNGNAGKKIGDDMSGGTIRLNGEYERIGDVRCGLIYHKGKLIR
ncbi:MAG: hypothetical protein PHF60_02340 [Candidatus ainarchaeum sp.]|nr:hypothetical protein [Candidatus ainarchaeum sp.]